MPRAAQKTSAAQSIAERVDGLDWKAIADSLSQRGYAVTAPILTPEECASLAAMYGDETRFRSRIIMERYRFGVGDYKYFDNPLPEIVASLRTSAYPHLASVANEWAENLGEKSPRFPEEHAAFLKTCHKAGQAKPTPLLLHYEVADTTAYTRISMARLPSRCRWFFSSASQAVTGKEESSY